MIRVACVGCGEIMQQHYQCLSALDNVEFAGHCDPDQKRTAAAAAHYGGKAFKDHASMFDAVKPDAVYICVPPFAHGPIELAAAERGIHMFIEKPVGLDAEVARQVAAAVRKSKVLTSVGYCYRYRQTVALARKMLKGKAISLVNGCWAGGLPQAEWGRNRNKSGGQILEQSTHLFDLVRYLCGEVAEVHGVASNGCMTPAEECDIDDSSVVSLRLKNGATGCITSTCVMRYPGRVNLEIITPEATLTLVNGALSVTEPDKTTEYRASTPVYAEEDRAFIDAVSNGKRGRIRSTYADALKTLLVTLAANDSIASGLPAKP